MKGMLIAYHCRMCGGVVDIYKSECPYCGTVNDNEYISKHEKLRKVRIATQKGDNLFYIDSITNIECDYQQPKIDTTLPWSEKSTSVRGIADNMGIIRIESVNTPRLANQLRMMRAGINEYFIEFVGVNKCFHFEGYMNDIKTDWIQGTRLVEHYNIVTTAEIKEAKISNTIPKDLRCPNCGAPIKSRLGVCDYCKGWVEWKKWV